MRVVPTFDPLEHRHSGFCLAVESASAQQLSLERGKETLSHGIVVRITDRSHRGSNTGLAAPLAERHRRILAALVAVVDDVPGPTLANSHIHRVQHQFGAEVVRHRPAVKAGEKMHRRAGAKMHHGQMEKPAVVRGTWPGSVTLNSAFQFDR